MNDYKEEYENCMSSQQKLLKALRECNDKEKIDFVALSQKESQDSQNILLEKHYLDKNVTGSTDECFYRFKISKSEPDTIFCIKHGSLESLNAYETYKKRQEKTDLQESCLDYIWIGIGVVIFIYFVFIDKGKLP